MKYIGLGEVCIRRHNFCSFCPNGWFYNWRNFLLDYFIIKQILPNRLKLADSFHVVEGFLQTPLLLIKSWGFSSWAFLSNACIVANAELFVCSTWCFNCFLPVLYFPLPTICASCRILYLKRWWIELKTLHGWVKWVWTRWIPAF